jgi:hypothetical protein
MNLRVSIISASTDSGVTHLLIGISATARRRREITPWINLFDVQELLDNVQTFLAVNKKCVYEVANDSSGTGSARLSEDKGTTSNMENMKNWIAHAFNVGVQKPK